MLKRLKEHGLHICVWINPYIAQRSPLFAEGSAAGLLAEDARRRCLAGGSLAARHGHCGLHQPGGPPMVRRQAARAAGYGRGLLQDRFWRAHPNRCGLLSTAPTQLGCTTITPTSTTRLSSRCWKSSAAKARRWSLPARPPPAASSFPVHWGGDSTSTFESMAESLRGGLSLGLSGFGFWSHDIGGFEQTAAGRRVQALVRLRPALVAQPAARQQLVSRALAVRRGSGGCAALFTKLKCRLMPYLYRRCA